MSPAENVVKEAEEETGLIVRPLYLMAIIDSRKAGSIHRHIYSHLFYCRIEGGELRPQSARGAGGRFLSAGSIARTALRYGPQMDRPCARVSFRGPPRNLFRSDGLRVFDDAESAFSRRRPGCAARPSPRTTSRPPQTTGLSRPIDAAPGSASSVCGSAVDYGWRRLSAALVSG